MDDKKITHDKNLPIKDQPKKGISNKTKIYIIIASFLAFSIIITIIAIVYTLLYVKDGKTGVIIDNTTPTIINSLTPTDELLPEIVPPVVLNSVDMDTYDIIYRLYNNNNYVAYDIETGNELLVFNYEEGFRDKVSYAGGNNVIFMRGLEVDTSLYFKVYSIDLKTKTITLLQTSQEDYYFDILNSFNSSSYLLLKWVDAYQHVIIFKNGVASDIGNLGLNPQRGGSYSEGGYRNVPSPDGNKMIITVYVAGNSIPYNIVDLNTGSITPFAPGYSPTWIDNTNILYASNGKLYVYSVSTNTTSLYSDFTGSFENCYGLHKEGSKLIYWKTDSKIYTYDLSTHLETKLIDNATSGQFFGPDKVLFSKVLDSLDSPSGKIANNLWIYDLTNGTEKRIVEGDLLTFLSSKDRGDYSCETITCSD